MTVQDIDRGWNRIKREVQKSGGVKVGVMGDAGTSDEGTDMLLIAAVNEFGSADGRVPERSYIRAGFDKNRSKLRNTAAALWGRVLDGDMDQRQALGLLGETHQDQVQKFLTALSAPPNAASTIARKRGSANPLIDTGRLRSSIRWVHDD